jgi:hypothetical protein
MSVQHHGQHQEQHSCTEGENTYYDLFDSVTNNGRVFSEDLNATDVDKTSLTLAEVNARNAYSEMVRRLNKDYNGMEHPIATTKEEVLQQRVVAPCLVSEDASSRSTATPSRVGRKHPKSIDVWTDFRQHVESYQIVEDDSSSEIDPINIIFYSSLQLATRRKCRTEAEEQFRLIDNLSQLSLAGIVHSVESGSSGAVGSTDFLIKNKNNEISIICECKSTQNLLLPMTADECRIAYDSASDQTNSFRKAYSNVANPIGQLLQYMVDNEHCHGALTSGTRTYFLKIQFPEFTDTLINEVDANAAYHMDNRRQAKIMKTCETNVAYRAKRLKTSAASQISVSCHNRNSNLKGGDEIKVYISDAWFVGEKNYLRAWAYVHNLRETMQPWQEPIDWIVSSTKVPTPEQRGAKPSGFNNVKDDSTSICDGRDSESDDGGGKFAHTCNMEYFYPLHHGAIPFAPYNEIVKVGILGEGRNGSCFKVNWKGTEYAMKQFDIGRHGDKYFEREIYAYMLLQDVWGILVPRPIFLSESYSGGVMFLGLQLGRASMNFDDVKEFYDILGRLKKEYRIRHNDPDSRRNMIVISDANGIDRVAVIDFEDWDEVPKHYYR